MVPNETLRLDEMFFHCGIFCVRKYNSCVYCLCCCCFVIVVAVVVVVVFTKCWFRYSISLNIPKYFPEIRIFVSYSASQSGILQL